MPETAKRTARVPILGEDGRISDDYIPAAIGENVTKAEAAAKRAETAATDAEGSASAASQSATKASGSASAASESASQAKQSATAAGGAATSAQSAQTAAEAAKAAAETAQSAAAGSAQDAQQSATAAQQSAASVADKYISSAQATTLEPGSQATASVENQVLTIGVPKGDKGDKGDTGDKGDPGDKGEPGDTGAPGAAATIAVGSVSTLPAGSEATVENSGTANAAKLDFGIPQGAKGDKGDTGTGIPDGGTPGQLLSKTEDGTAWVDPPSGNVLKGTSTGHVAHAEDAYAQKPIEVRVKGRTVQNLWVNPSRTQNGVTCTSNADGSITVSGTATAGAYVTTKSDILRQGLKYTFSVSAAATGARGFYIDVYNDEGSSVQVIYVGGSQNSALSRTFTLNANAAYVLFGTGVDSGQTVSGTYRVMLNEGSTAEPWCPPGLNVVDELSIVTAGKNLLARMGPKLPYTTAGITFSDNGDGGIRVSGTATSAAYYNFFSLSPAQALRITPGEYTASLIGGGSGLTLNVGYFDGEIGVDHTQWLTTNVPSMPNTGSIDRPVYMRAFISVVTGTDVDAVVYPQLELGSTATAYEPPNVTETALPEVELRGLPDGTCDELVINADGTCEVERRTKLVDGEVTALPEPTTEPQSPVTLPNLPAPTFNQYHDADVPSDTSVEYARDINLVLANLESVQAALLGGE